jgi:hypothetical protein
MSEAMGTLRLLRGKLGPTQRVTSWPDVIHEASEAYGYTPARGTRPLASPRDIARLEEVERWITRWLTYAACEAVGLVPDTGYVVTCRGMGWTYARIGRARKEQWHSERRLPGGNSRTSIQQIEQRGLRHVATQLNFSGVPVDPETLSDRR